MWSVSQWLDQVKCRLRSEDLFGGGKGVTEEAAAQSEGGEDTNTWVSLSLVCSVELLVLNLYQGVATNMSKLPP